MLGLCGREVGNEDCYKKFVCEFLVEETSRNGEGKP
jgi:hypothetical protein